jgi:hypothetical protein
VEMAESLKIIWLMKPDLMDLLEELPRGHENWVTANAEDLTSKVRRQKFGLNLQATY